MPSLLTSTTADKSDIPAIEGYLMYSSDGFTAQLVGLYQDDDFGSDDWAIGGGANIGIAESFTLTAGAVVGEGTSSTPTTSRRSPRTKSSGQRRLA